MRLALIVPTAATLGLAACNGPATFHDKAYFAAHPKERVQTLVECRSDPGRLDETSNCVNAVQADADVEHERVFHGAPPPAPGVNNTGHL